MAEAASRNWHCLTAAEAKKALQVSDGGLPPAEAERRLAEEGPNRLPQSPPPSLVRIALRQLRSPLIYILTAAAAVSIAIGEHTDAAFIFAVLVLNGVIGTVQEWRAERSTRALQHLLRTHATVERGGETVEIDAEDVVPGDVVWLEPGARIPADLRLVWEQGLAVDESLLTGESLPVSKDASVRAAEDAALAERRNLAYAGTIATRGRARGVAVATGTHTVVGRLARDLESAEGGKPPLLLRLERFTRVIGIAVLFAAALAGAVGVIAQGHSIPTMFGFAVALAVSAIPEGLPVALTVALAVAARRMAARGVIVRRLAAVEALGSCTLVASDKTGTLTANELTVRAVHLTDDTALAVTGDGYAPDGEILHGYDPAIGADLPALEDLLRAAVLCNEASLHKKDDGEWVWRGDPTDVALLSLGEKGGVRRERELERTPEIATIPFEPDRRYAATFHDAGGSTRVFVKGAPERVLAMCELPDSVRESARETAIAMASHGYRVLAIADAARDLLTSPDRAPEEPSGLRWLGFVGMIDPLRAGVKDAVAACQHAGVKVAMVTGDHPVTALAIARELGLASSPGEVITGRDLADAGPDELRAIVRRTRVFARMEPHQKLQIVRAARAEGHFVAVTGDGVNDAPALREANVGVAMGRAGTDVAREASELVISDDNFATIVAGIEEGRVAYDNVRKVIYLLISTGAAEIVMVVASLIAGLPLPLLPVQLLWLNLVTNGIQDVALAFEPKEGNVLRRPPRPPRERIFDRLMIERTIVGAAVMGLVGFVAFQQMLAMGIAEADARNALLLLMVLFEIIHIGNCRSETQSLFVLSPLKSPILLTGTIVAFAVHVLAMHWAPLQGVLGTAPVAPLAWLVLFALALTVAVAMELHKLSWARRAAAARDVV